MAKGQKKTGKGRLDKYYKLAKEQGYRARSAFKLIQLNKKYGFLETAKCCIDLCAAPGGWLQVASKYMPLNSIIVGVDLVPIRPIPRVVTFAADITTPQCRNLIRNELKDWKADVVLHDGAPNVGTAWVQDAYSQSELVLMSLKLAVEFLLKGGTFVTKVFRSVDYNNLIWVFNQLFGKVEATKPPSSRNVSAEIFVVCRDFLAPKHIDPKFLDPRHVFKDLAASLASEKGTSINNVQANVFHPEKKRRKRDGYADGDYTLFKTVSATDYVKGSDPVSVLGTFNSITFTTEEEKEWLSMHITNDDVKANFQDLKVLGKGDFKTLIKWRLALRQELGLEIKARKTEEDIDTTEVTGDVDEEQLIQQELERLNSEAAARAKRERRRANEVKARTIQRMQLQMVAPLDIGLDQQDASLHIGQDDIFDLSNAERGVHGKRDIGFLLGNDDGNDADEEYSNAFDEENVGGDGLDSEEEKEDAIAGLEDELDGLYNAYQDRLREKDYKFRVREMRERKRDREEWRGIQDRDSDEEGDNNSDSEIGWGAMEEARMGVSDDTSDASSEESTQDTRTASEQRKRTISMHGPVQKRRRLVTDLGEPTPKSSTATQLWFSRDVFARESNLEIESNSEEESDDSHRDGNSGTRSSRTEREDQNYSDPQSDKDIYDFDLVPQESDDVAWDIKDEDQDEVKRAKIKGQSGSLLRVIVTIPILPQHTEFGLLSAEAVTLAQQLVNREKTRTQLINDGFNRYSLNSKEGLPSWFLDDEAKHYKSNIPVTREAMAALRMKQRALDARPIKKVAEAKARKKMKAAQRLEKAMKKAEGIKETADMTEREKAQQIEKLMRKGSATSNKKKEIKVVVAKGPHKGIKGRPKGVKGRYAMVDARMKKEVRAQKRKEKASKKRKRP
ncbi:hypothetical protein AX17_000806 [Amanita inopinata Kibby_2008]|nr:hypothetical protein AX17_000806 [Amanita inopinata Kibby_2008]